MLALQITHESTQQHSVGQRHFAHVQLARQQTRCSVQQRSATPVLVVMQAGMGTLGSQPLQPIQVCQKLLNGHSCPPPRKQIQSTSLVRLLHTMMQRKLWQPMQTLPSCQTLHNRHSRRCHRAGSAACSWHECCSTPPRRRGSCCTRGRCCRRCWRGRCCRRWGRRDCCRRCGRGSCGRRCWSARG
jgi:hypothetical protein